MHVCNLISYRGVGDCHIHYARVGVHLHIRPRIPIILRGISMSGVEEDGYAEPDEESTGEDDLGARAFTRCHAEEKKEL